MKVLLTGDRGYIGTVLSAELKSRGHEVIGLDNNYFKDCWAYNFSSSMLINRHKELEDFEHHIDMDIRNLRMEHSFSFEDFDAVIHLAALSNDIMGDIDPEITTQINTVASIGLAAIAKRAGIKRFIFASSCSVYGSNPEIVDEGSELNPQTVYAMCKADAEMGISILADDNFSPTYLRNATVYGFSPRMRNDLVVNTMVANAHATGKIKVMGDGSLWRPLVHVKDVAKACRLVLEAPIKKTHNKTFNIGFNSENYTIGQIASMIKYQRPEIEVEYIPSTDTRNYHVNFDNFHNAFPEFDKPYRTVEEEIKNLFEFYKDLEATIEKNLTSEYLMGWRFIRLLHLKNLMEQEKIGKDLKWL